MKERKRSSKKSRGIQVILKKNEREKRKGHEARRELKI